MGLSETILAAMIGAIATVSGALFQIFTALKRGKVDVRPKKGSAMRSVLAVLALMVASAAGGFLYSEFIKQRSAEDMRGMRQELKELTALIAQGRDKAHENAAVFPPPQDEVVPVSMTADGAEASAESVVYVPACRRSDATAVCAEGDAQRIALCGTVPSYARVDRIDLFVQPDAVQNAWDKHRAELEQDLGGARFTGRSFEYAQGDDLKAVCVNFMHWSSEHPHIARILVRYGFGDAPAPVEAAPAAPSGSVPVQSPAVITAETMPAIPQNASLAAPVTVQ